MAQLVETSARGAKRAPDEEFWHVPTRPTGLITFLFTDIVGSTRAWDLAPHAMGRALRQHDRVVRAAIEHVGGFVFCRAGDSFAAAFERSREALRAALDLQDTVRDIDWPEGLDITVRCVLHRGVAEHRDGTYFGPDVNLCSRLLSLCSGGQIAFTDSLRLAAEAVRDRETFTDLGWQRLPDIRAPHRVWVVASG